MKDKVNLVLKMEREALELIDQAAHAGMLSRDEFIKKSLSLGVRFYLPSYDKTTFNDDTIRDSMCIPTEVQS